MYNMNGETVSFDTKNNFLVIIDQTVLPFCVEQKEINTLEGIIDAIQTLKVRGAPAIGVAAAIGIAVTANNIETSDKNEFLINVKHIASKIRDARPTAVNLSWAVFEMLRVLEENEREPIDEIKKCLTEKAKAIHKNDIECCRKIGENGAELLKNCKAVLTHCNAGRLATVKYGTALAPIYVLHERNINIKVYADETRPLLQGARLTAFELNEQGIDVTVICDNMAATVMQKKLIDAVIVGADRIARNGDTANKIGTSGLAVLAKYYGIPFYVAAPFSTIDKNTKDGESINIEQRDENEIASMWYKRRMIPEKVKAFNPAFDVTKASLITAYITEKGVIGVDKF